MALVKDIECGLRLVVLVKNNPDTGVNNATARQKKMIFFKQHPRNTKLNE